MKRMFIVALSLSLMVCTSTLQAQQLFSKIIGAVEVRPVQKQSELSLPFITWGGDVATFVANGGLKTSSDSLYAKLGLRINMTAGDDFVSQVKNYLGGKTPFIRGTMRMLGQASEVIGKNPDTKPVVILQLSFSEGDHIVSRAGLKTLNDLKRKGKKVRIACQQGGPHVGLLYDALRAANLKKADVQIEFVKDLTGKDGPAEKFRTDKTIDACCVITPDMIGLTGGIDAKGSGAEGTVKDAHVLVSTQQMNRSVADVYAVRSDWYKDNRATVEKLVAGYLKAREILVKQRDNFEKTKKISPAYRATLTMSQKIFGKKVIPTLEVDAHGLLLDCRFMTVKGQLSFFEVAGNLNGFNYKMKAALDMATSWGYAKSRYGFDPSGLDYQKITTLANTLPGPKVTFERPKLIVGGGKKGDPEGGQQFPDDINLKKNTIVNFTISFEPNQKDFSVDRYRAQFDRALRSASSFGGAAVVIRGHSDPTRTLINLLKAGVAKGLIRQQGKKGSYSYFLRGKKLDLTQTKAIVDLIKDGAFEGTKHSPLQTMQAALNLSLQRAAAVKAALTAHARKQGISVNLNQLTPIGTGITDPVISKPKNLAEAKRNMRVEFRIVKVNPEKLTDKDFDF